MDDMHEKHPEYAWGKNKGYPTKAHRAAIKEHGPTEIHRRTFRLLDEQLSLEL
jgi:ribonuclease HII